MKVRIIRSVPADVQYPDADTGQLDSDNRQASEPVRVLPAALEVKPVSEEDLDYIRKVLKYDRPSKLKYLAGLIGSPDGASTDAFIRRGDDFILEYYRNKIEMERREIPVQTLGRFSRPAG